METSEMETSEKISVINTHLINPTNHLHKEVTGLYSCICTRKARFRAHGLEGWWGLLLGVTEG